MKTADICWVFCIACSIVSVASAQTTNIVSRDPNKNGIVDRKTTEVRIGKDVIRKVVELDTDEDGEVDVRSVWMYQNSKIVFVEFWMRKNGWVERIYQNDGRAVFSEVDTDGDGRAELTVIFGKNQEVTSAFRRKERGIYQLPPGELRRLQAGGELGAVFVEMLVQERGR